MNIVGVGIDILSLERVKNILDIDRFSEYVLKETEVKTMLSSRDPIQFLASRFAAKEALIKAYPETINYHDIETGKDENKFIQKVLKPGSDMYTINSSISHSFENTIAVATVSMKIT